MKPYHIFTPENAPTETAETLRAINDRIGFVPNVFAVMGATPAALNGFAALNRSFGETSLSLTEREIVQLAASVENVGAYCVAGHTSFAKKQGVAKKIVEAVRTRGVIDDPKLAALHNFTRLIVIHRGNLPEGELEQFLDAGYSNTQLLEVILGICVKMFSNLSDNVLGFPLDEQFLAHAWDPLTYQGSSEREPEAA
jgi:uncharacterized peroxidase-related enzyme